MDNKFEKASKVKLRFESGKGAFAVEDLWDLSLASLDTMAQKVNKNLRDEGEQSFITNNSVNKVCTYNNLRLDLLKHVIETKVKEQDQRKARAERSASIAKLKELAEAKSNEQLASKSLEDILKQIAELEAQEATV